MTAHAAKVTTSPITSAHAVARNRRVATVQTSSGHIRNFAEIARPSAHAGWPHPSRYRHATAAANASGIEMLPSSTPLTDGTQRSAAA